MTLLLAARVFAGYESPPQAPSQVLEELSFTLISVIMRLSGPAPPARKVDLAWRGSWLARLRRHSGARRRPRNQPSISGGPHETAIRDG